MADQEPCPICGELFDKRGLNGHIRTHQTEETEDKNIKQEGDKMEDDIKNSKAPRMLRKLGTKAIMAFLGVLALILMLIFQMFTSTPQNQNQNIPRRPGRRL